MKARARRLQELPHDERRRVRASAGASLPRAADLAVDLLPSGIYFFVLPSSAFSVKGQDELCSYMDLDTASGKPMQRSYCRTCFSFAVFSALAAHAWSNAGRLTRLRVAQSALWSPAARWASSAAVRLSSEPRQHLAADRCFSAYPAGLFPAESLPPPGVELFTAECAPWYRLHEGAAHFEGMPPK